MRVWSPAQALLPSGPLGWTLQPELLDHPVDQVAPRPDFTVTTNADGLRTPHGRTPQARRIAVFGDSTVFGWGLPATQTPAAVLQGQLGVGWEVVNAGQPGYSSEQAQRLVQSLVPLYSPELVIWFQPWTDLTPAQATDRELLPMPSDQRPFWRASRLLTWLEDQAGGPGHALQHNPLQPLRYDGPGDTTRVTASQREENLGQVARAIGPGRLLVVLLPNDATASQRDASPLAEEISRVVASLDAQWLDLSGSLDPRELLKLTLPGDPGHFNATGNTQLMKPVTRAVTEGFADSP